MEMKEKPHERVHLGCDFCTHILVQHLNNGLVVVIESKLTKTRRERQEDIMCDHHMSHLISHRKKN